MALASIGGGRQLGDGNVSEPVLGNQGTPGAMTSTATMTAAQLLSGILVGNPSTSAASYTLPTVAALEAVLVNAKVNSTFTLSFINIGTSSGIVTILVGTGWTLVGDVTVPITSANTLIARKTGDGSWTLYIA
jgi:hypothetical protein